MGMIQLQVRLISAQRQGDCIGRVKERGEGGEGGGGFGGVMSRLYIGCLSIWLLCPFEFFTVFYFLLSPREEKKIFNVFFSQYIFFSCLSHLVFVFFFLYSTDALYYVSYSYIHSYSCILLLNKKRILSISLFPSRNSWALVLSLVFVVFLFQRCFLLPFFHVLILPFFSPSFARFFNFYSPCKFVLNDQITSRYFPVVYIPRCLFLLLSYVFFLCTSLKVPLLFFRNQPMNETKQVMHRDREGMNIIRYRETSEYSPFLVCYCVFFSKLLPFPIFLWLTHCTYSPLPLSALYIPVSNPPFHLFFSLKMSF